jgi:hypothetical protein
MYRRYGYTYSAGKRSYYPYGRRYGYRRGAVARAQASGAAAKRADKQENLNVTAQGYFKFVYGTTNPPMSNVIVFHPYIGGVAPATGTTEDATLPIHGGAVNDRSFRLKCSQYDEVRLDSMRVYINPIVSNSAVTTPPMTISTIWDRKAGPKECGVAEDSVVFTSGRVPTAQEVSSNEGAIKSITNMNSTRGIVRSIYAKNMQEKSFFWDSTIHYNTTVDQSPLAALYLDAWEKKDGSFCPALYVCSELSQTTVFGDQYTCSYRVEYNFTFRNPKSEMQDFIILENPTYVNEMGREATRSASSETTAPVNTWLVNYRKQAQKALNILGGGQLEVTALPFQTKSVPTITEEPAAATAAAPVIATSEKKPTEDEEEATML